MSRLEKFFRLDIRGNNHFLGSAEYWENRYKNKGNSGPGSYGRLAWFKANVINEFINCHEVNSVVEYGCGDGNQLKLLKYPRYLGLDVSDEAIKKCREMFRDDKSKEFIKINPVDIYHYEADLVVSLDVIFHLVENVIYETYMQNLFNSSLRYVIIYSSNFSEKIASHVLSRKFEDWINNNVGKQFQLIKRIPNEFPYDKEFPLTTSISEFFIYERKGIKK